MISVFDENYNRNYLFDNNQSMLDFNRDDLDYSQKYLNDELISFDQSIEIENQKMIDLWNDGKSDEGQGKSYAVICRGRSQSQKTRDI